MLLRAALVVEDEPLVELLSEELRALSVWADPLPYSALGTAEDVGRFDLILTGPERTSQEIEALLDLSAMVAESPAVVRLYRESNPEAQTALLAAGLEASIWVDQDRGSLHRALGTVTDRKRAALRATLGPHEEGPLLRHFRSVNPRVRALVQTAHAVARTRSTLLLHGETGAGKEWLARAIHAESPVRDGPFIPVNCGALPENLLESELFGHEKGAFTGAANFRRGYFELAHGGTLFLDEIGEMPIHLQTRLLRVLEDRTVQRLGSERWVKVDVRVIAATHRDLRAEVDAGRFRADLFYRLRVLQLEIPALRDRADDIPSLARYHALLAAERLGIPPVSLSWSVLSALSKHTWPGNLRELANVVERLIILNRRGQVTEEDLPEDLRPTPAPVAPLPVTTADVVDPEDEGEDEAEVWTLPWKAARRQLVDRVERAYFERLLARTGGKVGEAARAAGMSERGLFEKMKHHGLSRQRFKKPSG